MHLNEQKKQALERYVNQSYTQQQIANALGNKLAIPATHKPATPTATTGNKSAIPATHEPSPTLHQPATKRQFQQPRNLHPPLQQPATNRQFLQPNFNPQPVNLFCRCWSFF